jgi:signal transduction histidine kinase
VERTRVLAPELAVQLEFHGAPELRAEFDSDTVTEILSNLLDNARRHAAHQIRVTITVDDRDLQVRVSDDGSGVPETAVDRIFDRFVSLDGKGGSGLGLPIARDLARARGGDIVYCGERENGAAFLLTLPLGIRRRDEVSLET